MLLGTVPWHLQSIYVCPSRYRIGWHGWEFLTHRHSSCGIPSTMSSWCRIRCERGRGFDIGANKTHETISDMN
ncbi:unnamed protein product [Fusarium fujikuroi]|uniref:Uncharacterized protein n=1 Tax=Fusarium fujikuroi TaxID=5127 RepID=A0A9Q9UHG0_FUSFU|nr:unnamed protein product [Fusarium fujikuroi]VTT84473.1 unnamed protein product [Fusarium fujikuroi]